MRNIKNDLAFGKKYEIECMNFLNEHGVFGGNFKLTDSQDKFHNFDMTNGNIYVEHKKRPNLKFHEMWYDSLYFDKVKYTRYLKMRSDPNLDFYIIWTCDDGRFIWKFQDQFDDEGNAKFYEKRQYEQDRGKGYLQDTDMICVFREEINELKI